MGAASGKSATLSKTLNILASAQNHPNRNLLHADVLMYAAIEAFNRGESIGGGKMIYQAWQLLNEQEKLYPAEPFNLKWKAILGASAASVPANYRWIGTQLGIALNPDTALLILEHMYQFKTTRPEQKMWSFESGVLAAFLQRYIKSEPELAFYNIQKRLSKSASNPLNCFLFNSFALSTRNSAKIQPENCHAHIQTLPFIAYQLGLACLYELSPDAESYLSRFLLLNKDEHYIKSTLQKLSWNAFIHQDVDAYETYRKRILLEGNKINDEDQQAYREAQKNTKPNASLLRLRLLYDGGNVKEALNLVAAMHYSDFTEKALQTEYLYRKGRILEANGRMDAALRFYRACKLMGKDLPEYYAVKSCLLLAAFEEKNGKCIEATKLYREALNNKYVRTYRRSLEQEARAGIQRCTAND